MECISGSVDDYDDGDDDDDDDDDDDGDDDEVISDWKILIDCEHDC